MRLFFAVFACALLAPVVDPGIDPALSGFFYRTGSGFFLADSPVLVGLHNVAYGGARVLGALFVIMAIIALMRRAPIGGLDAKAWLFLLLALVIGPGLVANVGLKDHWGRARPREVTAFGGSAPFTPALEPHVERARPNGSFVAGDAAFGFFLPAFAFVAPPRLSRRVFAGGMLAGTVFGLTRILMGAHFFSDVVYAAAAMLATVTIIYAGVYGRDSAVEKWRRFLNSPRIDV